MALASDPETHAEFAQRLREHYLEARRAVLAGLIRQAVAAGQLRPDLHPDLLIDMLLGTATYRANGQRHPRVRGT